MAVAVAKWVDAYSFRHGAIMAQALNICKPTLNSGDQDLWFDSERIISIPI